jgi:hypothetical protein
VKHEASERIQKQVEFALSHFGQCPTRYFNGGLFKEYHRGVKTLNSIPLDGKHNKISTALTALVPMSKELDLIFADIQIDKVRLNLKTQGRKILLKRINKTRIY